MRLTLFLFILVVSGCDWIGEKAKETAKAGGEVAGEVAGEFIEGVHDGVEEVTSPALELHENLEAAGLELGEYKVLGNPNKHTLQIYLIKHQDIDRNVRFIARNSEGREIGRASLLVQASANDAGYHEVVFDERTHLETSSSIRIMPIN